MNLNVAEGDNAEILGLQSKFSRLEYHSEVYRGLLVTLKYQVVLPFVLYTNGGTNLDFRFFRILKRRSTCLSHI